MDLIPKAAAYMESVPQVEFAYLFGGLVKHGVQPLSDVDVAVHLDKKADFAETRLEILGRLVDTLKTDEIDLVLLNNACLSLRMEILENRIVIVDKKPFTRHAYESLTMREYFDFSYIEKGILTRRFLNG